MAAAGHDGGDVGRGVTGVGGWAKAGPAVAAIAAAVMSEMMSLRMVSSSVGTLPVAGVRPRVSQPGVRDGVKAFAQAGPVGRVIR